MLTVCLYIIWPRDRYSSRPRAVCVGSVTYNADSTRNHRTRSW